MSELPFGMDELEHDLFQLVHAGLVEVVIREDGEWVYQLTELGKSLSDDELKDFTYEPFSFDL